MAATTGHIDAARVAALRAGLTPWPQLGRYVWEWLHTCVEHWAADPAAPTRAEQEGAVAFFTGLAVVFHCEVCRPHLVHALAARPVAAAVRSRAALRQWLVDLHNDVNDRLGKPRVDAATAEAVFAGNCAHCTKDAALRDAARHDVELAFSLLPHAVQRRVQWRVWLPHAVALLVAVACGVLAWRWLVTSSRRST